jgi:RNA polymerase sigma-70 factor (ECF subfamily)
MAADFREFYREHVRFVWRALLRLGVRESEVADAVQEAFMVVHRKLGEFGGRSKPTTWLFAICMRVASERRRRSPLRREVPWPDDFGQEVMDDNGIAAIERGQARALLESILEKMPDEQRIVFVLFELEELSAEQIAALLDISEGTVRSRLRLARGIFQRATVRLRAAEQRLGKTLGVLAESWR